MAPHIMGLWFYCDKKEYKNIKSIMKITNYEKKNYVLNSEENLKILSIIKKLEKRGLNKKDKEILKLSRTQLKKDWQTPLITYLNKLTKKYKK